MRPMELGAAREGAAGGGAHPHVRIGHMQTDFSAGAGNALQACIATMLGRETLKEVPNFVAEGGADYMDFVNEFLSKNTPPLALVKVPLGPDGKLPHPVAPGTRCVLVGKSPRGDFKHAVVATVTEGSRAGGPQGPSFQSHNTLACVHDPHPDGSNVEAPHSWAGFICLK